jgi:hypothetical protein
MFVSFKNLSKKIVNGEKDKIVDTYQGPDFKSSEISVNDYKENYIKKFGLRFTIPSLNVRSSAWWPVNPSYFVQIVNYVVPTDNEFIVETHYEEDRPKDVSTFENIFAERIKGCTIRLIQTHDDLDSISVVDQYVYAQIPRVDGMNISFSIDG